MEDNKVYNYARYLSPLDVWAVAFGCTVGWGAFMLPGTTFLPVAGPLGTLIAMVISAVLILIIGGNISFLMRHNAGTGGIYAYTKEALGRNHAFLCSWFLSLSYLAILFLNATSLFNVIRVVFGNRLQEGYLYYNIGGNVIFMGEVGASIVALSCVGLLFINAKPLLQRLQTILAVLLLVGILVIAGFCLPHMGSLSGSFGVQNTNPFFGIFSIVMLAPLPFFGFEVISLETVHFDFKVRHSRWIIALSVLLSGVCYVALTLVSTTAVPDGYASWQAYIADLGQLKGLPSAPTFFAAKEIMGQGGLWLVAFAALAAILTGIIAAYRATTRILATMSEDHILSNTFSKTTHSILFVMVISILISIFGGNALGCFLELAALGAAICFGYASFSTWKLARQAGRRLFAVTGAVGTVASIMFAAVNLIPKLAAMEMMSTQAFILLAIWCLLGLVFYSLTVSRSGEVTNALSGTVMFALLLYSALMWLGKQLVAADSLDSVRSVLKLKGSIALGIIAVGLVTMIINQYLVRRKLAKLAARPEGQETASEDEDSPS